MSTARKIYSLSRLPENEIDEWFKHFLATNPDFSTEDLDVKLNRVESTMVALSTSMFDLRIVAENLLHCEHILNEEKSGQLITKHEFERASDKFIEKTKLKIEKFKKGR